MMYYTMTQIPQMTSAHIELLNSMQRNAFAEAYTDEAEQYASLAKELVAFITESAVGNLVSVPRSEMLAKRDFLSQKRDDGESDLQYALYILNNWLEFSQRSAHRSETRQTNR